MAKRRKYKTRRKKGRYSKAGEQEEKLKNIILATILIPVALLVAFVFFGPKIGSIFGIFSTNTQDNSRDRLAPPAPVFKDAPKAVKEVDINLEGFAETGSTVFLFVNGPETESTVVTNDGTFLFENIILNRGRNTIFAKSIDGEGNESEKSETLKISVDDDRPELEITEPKDGETVKNLNKRITVKGELNEKASITVNGKLAVQKPDNSFEIVLGVNEGWVKIEVEAEDEAGNSVFESISVLYEKSSG